MTAVTSVRLRYSVLDRFYLFLSRYLVKGKNWQRLFATIFSVLFFFWGGWGSQPTEYVNEGEVVQVVGW